MPTHVTTIELSEPLRAIELPPEASGLFAVLMRDGCPQGMLRVAGRLQITREQLRKAIDQAGIAGDSQKHAMPTQADPISIIVCTHERPDDLERCLTALLPAHAQGHEVIVVDNAPRSQAVAAVAARFPYRYLVEPQQGLDYARNCGLFAARHALVAYTDDDAVPDAGWANAISRPFGDSAIGCVTGLVLPLELVTNAQEQFEEYCLNRRIFTPRRYVAPSTPPATGGVAGMGANMAFRRELLLALGGFDPRLDGGMPTCSGGDTDMFARVLDHGASILYTPAAFVWHRHRREMHELRACIFGYGVGLSSFLAKRVREQRDMYALITAARWWAGPPIKALWRRMRGLPTAPADLIWREAAGMFFGPLRLAQAEQRRRRNALCVANAPQGEYDSSHP